MYILEYCSENNRETEASGIGWELFSQYVRALHEVKPKFFIYENNKSMSKKIEQSITETFGFKPDCINSALVSGQSRQRLYWVGKLNDNGTYSKVNIPQPEDEGILLKDVLDNPYSIIINEKNNGKSRTIDAHMANLESNLIPRINNQNPTKQQYDCIMEPVNTSIQVGALPRPNGELSKSQGFRIYNINAKSVTIKGLSGGAGGKTGLYAIPIEFDRDVPIKVTSGSDGKVYTVYEVKNGLITIKGITYPIKLSDGYYIIRKLTVTECKHLQTVPDWYEFPVSNTQAYKLLGNGWTINVIVHILKICFSDKSMRN